jgi:hypothetical protein
MGRATAPGALVVLGSSIGNGMLAKKVKGCSEHTCPQPVEKGAHVQKVSGDQSWYIIPPCTWHNN